MTYCSSTLVQLAGNISLRLTNYLRPSSEYLWKSSETIVPSINIAPEGVINIKNTTRQQPVGAVCPCPSRVLLAHPVLDLADTLKNDGLVEKLDNLMEGQSHRARLNQFIANSGGQQYEYTATIKPAALEYDGDTEGLPWPSSTASAPVGRHIRPGRGGGIAGTQGRGSPPSSKG